MTYAVGVFCLRQPLDAAREPWYLIFVGVRFSALRAENRTQMIEKYQSDHRRQNELQK
jgi:hypothetical protein